MSYSQYHRNMSHKGYNQDSRHRSVESRHHSYDRRSGPRSCRPADPIRQPWRTGDQQYRPRDVERRRHDDDRRRASRHRLVVGEVRHYHHHDHEERRRDQRYREHTHRRPSVCSSVSSVTSVPSQSDILIEETELVTFPELWSTLMTSDMELQMEQWRQESDVIIATTSTSRGQSVVRSESVKDAAAGLAKKRSFTEMAGVDSCVSGPSPKIHINPNHAAFRHFHY